MKLYILKRENASWEEARGLLIRANGKWDARKIAYEYDDRQRTWLSPKLASCIEVTKQGEAEVLLEDNVGA